MNRSKQNLELEIICFEKAKEYSYLYIGNTSRFTALTVHHLVSGKDGSDEHMKSKRYYNYLHYNECNKHKLLNSCLAGYGLKATVGTSHYNASISIVIEVL